VHRTKALVYFVLLIKTIELERRNVSPVCSDSSFLFYQVVISKVELGVTCGMGWDGVDNSDIGGVKRN
jgi:hypothetical protein